jgi:hypothetical protein
MSITEAYALSCGVDIGGISEIYFANKNDVASFTWSDINDRYNYVTMETGKVFYKIEFENAMWTRNDDNSTVLTVGLGKISQASQKFVRELRSCGKCGVIAILIDANGVKWVVGYDEEDIKDNPLILENATSSTAARGDDTENIINFVRLKMKLDDERIFSPAGTIPV